MRINNSKSIYIGDHVWIGQNALILKNTQIGSGSIIGAMSLVSHKKVASNCVYAGNPAQKIKENIFLQKIAFMVTYRKIPKSTISIKTIVLFMSTILHLNLILIFSMKILLQ